MLEPFRNVLLVLLVREISTLPHQKRRSLPQCVCPSAEPSTTVPSTTAVVYSLSDHPPEEPIACPTLIEDVDECKILKFVSLMTRPNGLLRNIFQQMLNLSTPSIDNEEFEREIQKCFPALPEFRTPDDWSESEHDTHAASLRSALLHSSHLLRRTIKSMYNDSSSDIDYLRSIGDHRPPPDFYPNPLDRVYYETAHIVFARQLYCPVDEWSRRRRNRSIDQTADRSDRGGDVFIVQNCRWDCGNVFTLCEKRERMLIEFLQLLIVRINEDVDAILMKNGC